MPQSRRRSGKPTGRPLARSRFFDPVDAASVAVFRIAFGAMLTWEVARYFSRGWIDEIYVDPPFHFTYAGFGWVRPWPGIGMHLHFLLLGILGVLLAAGLFYRIAAVLSFLGWTYVFLLEQAAYLNHLYLVLLISALMIVVPAHRAFSLDAGRHPEWSAATIPRWALWALRLQIAIPYVFGGIAKLNADWLQGQPMQIWMSRMTDICERLPWFGDRGTAVAASWFGCVFDLLVVPLLLWPRTRVWACAAAVLFHLANAAMFYIGIFPWTMICATTLFFPPDWPRRFLRGQNPAARAAAVRDSAIAGRIGMPAALGAFFLVQLLVPFRHWLYPGNVDWTESGYRFSWRMMLHDKSAAISMVLRDRRNGRTVPVRFTQHLTPKQLDAMSTNPWMIRRFARALRRELQRNGYGVFEVRAFVLCSLNGRKPQLLIDPEVDLAADDLSRPWILPLREPLRATPWNVPQSDWLKHVDVGRRRPEGNAEPPSR